MPVEVSKAHVPPGGINAALEELRVEAAKQLKLKPEAVALVSSTTVHEDEDIKDQLDVRTVTATFDKAPPPPDFSEARAAWEKANKK